jgi:hypothetical protein
VIIACIVMGVVLFLMFAAALAIDDWGRKP